MQADTPDVADQGQVKTRKTPRQGDYDQPLSKHTPTALALTERQRAEFWKMFAIGTLFVALVLSWLIVQAGRSTEQIFVMDAAGNITAGPLDSLSRSKGYFNMTSIVGANVMLQRSPSGLDLYDMVKLYCSSRAAEKLADNVKKYEEDIKKRNLQEKPIIDVISEPIEAGHSRLVEVKGRVVIAGAYSGKSFYDEKEFTLTLTYGRNPDLGKAGAYPWIIEDFDLSYSGEAKK